MKKFSIQPVDAADDMLRNYRRELRRHNAQQRERATQVAVALVVVGLIAIGVLWATQRTSGRELPKTAYEVRAEQAAKARAAAAGKPKVAAKPKAAETGGDAAKAVRTSAARTSGGTTATRPDTAPKPAAKPAGTPRTAVGGSVSAARLGSKRVTIAVGPDGFAPAKVEVAFGTQLQILVKPAPEPALAGFRIPALDVEADNTTATVTVSLGMPGRGSYDFGTFDGRLTGTLVVR